MRYIKVIAFHQEREHVHCVRRWFRHKDEVHTHRACDDHEDQPQHEKCSGHKMDIVIAKDRIR